MEELEINKYIEVIYFFEVKIKFISSSVLKTSDFSRVRSTSENSYVFFFTHEMKYVWYLPKKVKFLFFYTFYRQMSHPLNKEVLKMTERNILANPNNFGTKIFVTFLLRKCIPTLDVFVYK